MSNLFTSQLLQSVVRRARTFSESLATPEDIPARSHAIRDEGPGEGSLQPGVHRDNAAVDEDLAGVVVEEENDGLERSHSGNSPGHAAGIRLRRAAATAREASTIESSIDDPLSAQDYSTRTTRSPPLASSPTELVPSVLASPPESFVDHDMTENPAYGIPERFRSVDSMNSETSSLASTTDSASISRRNRTRARGSSNLSHNEGVHDDAVMSGSLPADDGMHQLRQKIHQIRGLDVSHDEKAKMMHVLMTERYHSMQLGMAGAHSPPSVVSQEPNSPGSTIMTDVDMPSSSPISPPEPTASKTEYTLSPADLVPSFHPRTSDSGSVHEGDDGDSEEISFGCQHYKRNVKIQCFDCRKWYPCRHCHDAVERTHSLNRKKTQSMLCMLCRTPQPAGEVCTQCQQRAAWYYCSICKLWDDDARKKIYHCPDCGICRRGEGLGKDFIHCKKCNVCLTINFAESHRCIERATDCDCPICHEYLFTSSASVVSMPCGHYMHKLCYNQYMQTGYKCPICKKSSVNMELQWRKLDHSIQQQPMPAQYADTEVLIHCNDCEAKSRVKYHWLGHKCSNCDSYNTDEVHILNDPNADDAAQQAPVSRPRDIPAPTEQSLTANQATIANHSALSSSPSSPPSNPLHPPPRSPSYFLDPQPLPPQRRASSSSGFFAYLDRDSPAGGGDRGATSPGFEITRPLTATAAAALENARAGAAAFSPYALGTEMFQRVSRSVEPFRNYIGQRAGSAPPIPNLTEHARAAWRVAAASAAARATQFANMASPLANAQSEDLTLNDDVDFWGADGRFLSGDEDQGESEEGSDSDESMDDEEDEDVVMDDLDDEDDDSDNEFELLGHR